VARSTSVIVPCFVHDLPALSNLYGTPPTHLFVFVHYICTPSKIPFHGFHCLVRTDAFGIGLLHLYDFHCTVSVCSFYCIVEISSLMMLCKQPVFVHVEKAVEL